MTYKIEIEKKAAKFIQKQSKSDRERIFKAIYKLPEIGDIKSLRGHSSLYRLRVGDYRIIYIIDNGKMIIYVIDAGSRGQIYREY